MSFHVIGFRFGECETKWPHNLLRLLRRRCRRLLLLPPFIPSGRWRQQQTSTSTSSSPSPSHHPLFPSSIPHLLPDPSMEIQVFYLRLTCPSPELAPPSLTVRCCCLASSFEINRLRVPSSHAGATLTLRRDRMDADSAEAIYVCTDMIRTPESLSLTIYDQDDALVSANIRRSESWHQGSGSFPKAAWSLECRCALSSPCCSFMRDNGDRGASTAAPSMEICMAGRHSNSPVILAQTIELVVRRRHVRRRTLDAIPEFEESAKDPPIMDNLPGQVEEHMFYQELDLTSPARPLDFYERAAYLEVDDGELSWFNTGVRVGVGIGLGMCVGIGVGFGLLIRGYQATTKTLRRRLL